MTEQPIYVVKDTHTNKQKSPQRQNIDAAKIVAQTIKSTLGPKGMDKLLVNSMNEITITNDGVTILEELELQHPIAKMIVDIARTQEDEVGDGTTTAVILAGELLSRAEELLQRNIHPTLITKGFLLASEKALIELDKKALPLTITDKESLEKIVKTAMTGKGAEVAKEVLAKIVVEAVLISKSKEYVTVQSKVGHSVEHSKIIRGLIIDKTRVHVDMPLKITSAKIALLNCSLEVKESDADTKVSITNPSQLKEFIDQEELYIKELVKKIKAVGANVVFCQKGIDELAQYYFAKEGIFAVRRMRQSDMEAISFSTGSKIVYDVADLHASHLGVADVEESSKSDPYIMITNTKNDSVATIFISGGTPHVAKEAVRAVEDALGDLFSVIKSKKIVAGAGAIEIALARELLLYAKTFSGREQLAIEAFAKSLEVIPKTLAENAGLDAIDVSTTLYAAHEKGDTFAGLDINTGKSLDAMKEGIIEPIDVKRQAIVSATEVANMILRIDDVIATSVEQEVPLQNQRKPNVTFPDNL